MSEGPTYHLVPSDEWAMQSAGVDYLPSTYDADGFIHCTEGAENLIDTANRYYRDDRRAFVALIIDPSKVRAEVRYEDPARIYPHIYGAVNRDAIVRVARVRREADGTFVRVD